MDYEKLYKEALERARDLHDNHPYGEPPTWKTCEEIFPELLESEDEKIKSCIQMALTDVDEQRFNDYGTTLMDCIAWLEKQGEHKCDCKYVGCHVNDVKRWCHKKQAEILYEKCNTECPDYQKQGKQKPIEQDTETHDLWVYIREWNEKFGRLPKDEDELAACIDYVINRQKPADKVEQKHAWSEKHIADVFEKVGLARIVRRQGNDQLTNAVQSAMIELSKQQNPAYSEEDRKHIDNIISLLNQTKERFVRESGQFPSWITEILWLESIKDRIQPQQEWSEYDKIQLSETIQMIEANGTWIRSEDAVKKVSNWLKSLKPQPRWKPTEEQMYMLNWVANILLSNDGIVERETAKILNGLYNDLKSL